MNEQEAVAWMTKEGMTVRGDIAAILGWTGAIVGTGRAIPDAWIPFLYADKMRPNNELSVGGESALVTPEVLAAAGGSPAVFSPDTPIRQLFQDWVTRRAPIAEFTRNENGEYIVLGMQDEYMAFVAGWAARSH